MITFAKAKTEIGNRVGKTDSTALGIIGEFLNDRYQDIWDRANYPITYGWIQKACTADTETFVIDARDLDYIVDIHDRTNNIHLNPKSPQRGGREHADSQDVSSTPNVYWPESIGVLAQPAAAAQLSIASDSASDTSQKVRVWGRDANDSEISEEVTLTGVTAVTTTKTYTTVDSISKDLDTAGVVTITAGSITVARLNPYEYESSYLKIHLVDRPNAAITYTITFKKKFRRLINANDTFRLSCDRAVRIGAYCDALRRYQKDFALDQIRNIEYNMVDPDDPSTYEGAVRQILAKYEMLADNLPQGVPHVEADELDKT